MTSHLHLIVTAFDGELQNVVRDFKKFTSKKLVAAIVEHPYGVIKRQWDFYYIMTKKTIKHASADVGLIFTAYNLRRIFNLIDQNMLKQYLKVLALFFGRIRSFFKAPNTLVFFLENELPFSKKGFFMA